MKWALPRRFDSVRISLARAQLAFVESHEQFLARAARLQLL